MSGRYRPAVGRGNSQEPDFAAIVHHREYAVKARSIQEVAVEIPAPRGSIFDRDGRPLAMSLASRSVFINPMKVDIGVASDLLATCSAWTAAIST